jgi:hypothetical protein
MKFIVLSLLAVSFAWAGSGSSTKPLQGSYPIVLSHGVLGFDDTKGLVGGLIKYWGGMDEHLRSQGAAVLTPGTNPMHSVQNRANDQKNQISVNLVVNVLSKVIYGKSQQDIIAMTSSLTVANVNALNNTNPNMAGVKYYSYGSKVTLPDLIQHPIMGLAYPITWTGGVFNGQGGDNDGVVPLSSQKWGTWKGGPSYSILTTGVDHIQATNFSYMGETWFNVRQYYLTMASNAKNNQ